MWLFTRRGFYSITRSQEEPDKMQIRARERQDLEALMFYTGLEFPIIETPVADYRWRIIVRPMDAGCMVDAMVADIDYANFKAAVGAEPEQRHKGKALCEVWGIMRRFQTQDHERERERLLQKLEAGAKGWVTAKGRPRAVEILGITTDGRVRYQFPDGGPKAICTIGIFLARFVNQEAR